MGDDVALVTLTLATAQAKHAARKTARTVAIYAGMDAEELRELVRHALGLSSAVECVGFAVEAPSGGATKRSAKKKKGKQQHAGATTATTALVPLSLACAHPQILQQAASTSGGRTVTVVVAPASEGGGGGGGGEGKATKVGCTRSDAAPVEEQGASTADGSKMDRVLRLIEPLREDKSLTSFEAAVLAEICQVRHAHVLKYVLNEKHSIAEKKQFLLDLVHGGKQAGASAATASTRGRGSISRGSVTRLPTASIHASVQAVHKKLVSIARSVFSPEVQSQILEEASAFRDKKSAALDKVSRGGQTSALLSMEATLGQVLELLTVVERLLNKHALAEEHGIYLIRLMLAENRVLLSALQSYKVDFDQNALEETIKRIAALGDDSAGEKKESTTKSHRQRVQKALESLQSSSKKDASHKKMSPRKKKKERHASMSQPTDVLEVLHSQSMLTSLEFDLLHALIDQHDIPLLKVFDEYDTHRDLNILRDALVQIVEEITLELGDEEKEYLHPQEHLIDVVGPWQDHLNQFVRHWFAQRVLTQDQVQVLRQMISEDHNLLQSAYEVFIMDHDDQELMDTLQRIAKLQLQAMEGSMTQAFNLIVDHHCDVLRDHEKVLIKQLFQRRNELVRAAWEVYEAEKNVEDLGDTLLRIVRFTNRKDSRMRLVEVVGEMMHHSLILSHEADGLIQLFEERNDAMVAALEAFDSDGDVQELVETLLLVVKHANFGEPPQCTSPKNGYCGPPLSAVSSIAPQTRRFSSHYQPGTETYLAARLIEILGRKGRLSGWQTDVLLHLLETKDDRLMAVVDVYNSDRDAKELVDTLWRLCDLAAWEQNKTSLLSQWVEPLEKSGRIPRGVLSKLVAKRDDRVIAALVVYMGDGNADEFKDTLERIARIGTGKKKVPSPGKPPRPGCTKKASEASKTTEAPPAERQVSATPSMTRDADEELDEYEISLVLKAMVNGGDITAKDRAVIEALVSAADAQILAAFDVYQATGDTKDLADTLKRILGRSHGNGGENNGETSKAALMEKQLLHFAHELALPPNQLAALKQSILRHDAVLEAAVEVYEMEQDEDDLKDTLKRIAHHLVAPNRTQ